MMQKSFWFRFNHVGIPALSTVDIDIPVTRNIIIEGWRVVSGDSVTNNMLAALMVVERGGGLKYVCPTPWDDSVSAAGGQLDVEMPIGAAELTQQWEEIPISPYQVCDVEFLRIRARNAHASSAFWISGHVRGTYWG